MHANQKKISRLEEASTLVVSEKHQGKKDHAHPSSKEKLIARQCFFLFGYATIICCLLEIVFVT